MNKYRAWDKDSRKIYEVEIIDFKKGVIKLAFYGWIFLNDVILMQSTGLKDKNGVEIFDGDFIKFKHNQMSGRGFVFWNKKIGQWWIKDTREVTKKRGQRYYPFWEDCKYIVYGNIHANPELLKEV